MRSAAFFFFIAPLLYLASPALAQQDTDADGLPDALECPADVMPCPDTDGDGTPDLEDADDDNDGLSTFDERIDDRSRDTDSNGVPDHLDDDDDGDGLPTKLEREDTAAHGLADDLDDDDLENWRDTDSDGDGIVDGDEASDLNLDGIPDYLVFDAPEVLVPGLSGGALCSVGAPGGGGTGGLPGLVLLLLGFVMGRRRLPVAALLLAFATASLLPTAASAQYAPLEQYRPAQRPNEGFALSTAAPLRYLAITGQAQLGYANDPLVLEDRQGDAASESRALVAHLIAAHVGAALELEETWLFFGHLPIYSMYGQGPGSFRATRGTDAPSRLEPAPFTLGDLELGARWQAVGAEGDDLLLAAQFSFTVASGRLVNDSAYAGEELVSFHPELIATSAFGPTTLSANLGARWANRNPFSSINQQHDLTWALGVSTPLAQLYGGELQGYAEAFGRTALGEGLFSRAASPIELLVGAKHRLPDGWMGGAAIGGGVQRGFGAPDLRLIFMAGYSPAPLAQKPREGGPGDRDGDGFLDQDDACILEAEDKDGFEDDDGCPEPDNDGDKILDADDICPNEPEFPDGFEDDDGCPDLDDDGDGIPDAQDVCRLKPEDVDDFEDADGCPDEDNDGDGVLDLYDRCPLAPGRAIKQGCPISVRIDRISGQVRILDAIEFATDSDAILSRSMPILEEVRATLAANPQFQRVRIEGHTDERGTHAHNLDLSKRRAASVTRWMTEHRIPTTRLESWGCGKTRPAVDDTSKAGRQKNRRVEFHILVPENPNTPSTDSCVQAAAPDPT